MRFVKLSEEEVKNVSQFYQNMIGDAREILLYLSGKAVGEKISEHISDEEPLKRAGNMIKGRGWTEEITLEKERAVANGSIEIDKSLDRPSCNMIRGILCGVYEKTTGEIIEVDEVRCESLNDENCEFKIKKKEFEG
ncbi:MAG: V4R domain-containing protein [Candidatus Thermoplasmatota archaeon]